MSKTPSNKVKHSNYQIMISLNKTQPSEEDILKYKKSLEETFNEANLENLIEEGDIEKIDRIVIKHAIELAPEDNKLHSHSIIAITHRTRVKINLNMIRTQIKTLNSLDYTPYVHSKGTGGSEKSAIEGFLQYVDK